MEEEQIFLFAVFLLEEDSCKLNEAGTIEMRDYVFTLKRAGMQKVNRENGEKFERVAIEFDPLNNQQCYAVVAFFDKEDKKMLFKSQPKFAGIYLSEGKAEIEMQHVLKSLGKDIKGKKETFVDCRIYPTLITLN